MQALTTVSNALNVSGKMKKRRAVKTLDAVVNEFALLRNNLRTVDGYSGCPLDRLVLLFKAVSPFHDRLLEFRTLLAAFKAGNYDGSLTKEVEAISILVGHFSKAGRSQFGINRTKPGEEVTQYKVFLGDTYGLFTHPVPKWKEGKNEPKGGWGYPGMEKLNAYDAVCNQANSFVDSHCAPMIKALEVLGA